MDKKFLKKLLNITKTEFDELVSNILTSKFETTEDDFLLVQIIIMDHIEENFNNNHYNSEMQVVLDIINILVKMLNDEQNGINNMLITNSRNEKINNILDLPNVNNLDNENSNEFDEYFFDSL